MTKEELNKEAEEYAEGMAKYYASTHKDCIPSQFEKYLRNAYISSAGPREKRIAELEAQIEKMKEIILDLLWFEGELDPYMYECNDAQKGELLKPFDNARDILKDCVCKKCKGSGVIRVGYQGWDKNPCPSCKGRGYIIKELAND